jgi:hypothetical protein
MAGDRVSDPVIRALPGLLALRSVYPYVDAAGFALKLPVWSVWDLCGFVDG